jgi:hypothetical protein
MFNFHSINTAEVNATSQIPAPPVLSILPTEDISELSWNSPYFTDFFAVYWSAKPFETIHDRGVHVITTDVPTPGLTVDEQVSYNHFIPAVYSLYVLYYRVLAYNKNGDRP